MRKVKLVYKAIESYLPTTYPAYYYGSPDNKVYIIYASPYLTPSGKPGLEFIIARHEEFTYNYLEERLIHIYTLKTPLLSSLVDKKNLSFTNVKRFKSCKNYEDAEGLLNKWISEEILKNPKVPASKQPEN